MSVVPGENKAYIVVTGRPSVWHVGALTGPEALRAAEEKAARETERTQEDHTVMCVPVESLDYAVVAQYYGVVLKALSTLPDEEDT